MLFINRFTSPLVVPDEFQSNTACATVSKYMLLQGAEAIADTSIPDYL